MKIAACLLPVLFLAVILAAAVRRVRVYDSFAAGAAGALPLLKSLFPYIAAILVLSELFEASGLSQAFSKALSPLFSAVGIPSEISALVLIKPFSGSGSLALVSDVFVRRTLCMRSVCLGRNGVLYLRCLFRAEQEEKRRPCLYRAGC